LLFALGLSLGLALAPGDARAHGGWHGGGGGWHGGGGGGWHGGGHWRGGWGGWRGPGWGWGSGFGFGLGFRAYDPFWWGYPPYYATPPYYVAPPPVYAPPPPVYVPPAAAPAPAYPPAFYGWPVGIQEGTCNRVYLSQAAGGVTGVSVTGPEGGATLGGVFVGPLIGGPIARHMDVVDHACVMHALEFAQIGKTVAWQLSDGTPVRLRVTRTETPAGNQPCREYQMTARIGGRDRAALGSACRDPYGAWLATR